MTIPRWVFVNLLLFHRAIIDYDSFSVLTCCKCGICVGWWISHFTPQKTFPFLFTQAKGSPHRPWKKDHGRVATNEGSTFQTSSKVLSFRLQLVVMPWHLLFEFFNPAAVSGLCHAMGSVGVLFSSCDDLMVVNLVS